MNPLAILKRFLPHLLTPSPSASSENQSTHPPTNGTKINSNHVNGDAPMITAKKKKTKRGKNKNRRRNKGGKRTKISTDTRQSMQTQTEPVADYPKLLSSIFPETVLQEATVTTSACPTPEIIPTPTSPPKTHPLDPNEHITSNPQDHNTRISTIDTGSSRPPTPDIRLTGGSSTEDLSWIGWEAFSFNELSTELHLTMKPNPQNDIITPSNSSTCSSRPITPDIPLSRSSSSSSLEMMYPSSLDSFLPKTHSPPINLTAKTDIKPTAKLSSPLHHPISTIKGVKKKKTQKKMPPAYIPKPSNPESYSMPIPIYIPTPKAQLESIHRHRTEHDEPAEEELFPQRKTKIQRSPGNREEDAQQLAILEQKRQRMIENLQPRKSKRQMLEEQRQADRKKRRTEIKKLLKEKQNRKNEERVWSL